MKPQPSVPCRRMVHYYCRGLLALALVVGAVAGHAETLISCLDSVGGDSYTHGFYVPSFPGNRLDSVRLYFSGSVAGEATATLTVRASTYSGTVLGSDTKTFTLDGTLNQNVPVTFVFPSPRVTRNIRVCFILTRDAGAGSLFYAVPGIAGGCPEVVQTEGTNPP